MAARASALAQSLAEYTDDDILQALSLLISHRPSLQAPIADIMQAEPPQRYTGIISAFYEAKQFGFIKSDEVTRDFGSDTFLSNQELGSFTVGSAVTFSVAINKNNKPQARLLEAANGFAQPSVVMPPSMKRVFADGYLPPQKVTKGAKGGGLVVPALAGKGASKHAIGGPQGHFAGKGTSDLLERARMGVGAPGKGPQPAKGTSAMLERARKGEGPPGKGPQPGKGKSVGKGADSGDRRYVGVITAFYAQKKYGFIQSEQVTQEFGQDTFLSSIEIGSFGVDSVVSFKLAVNAKGKPQARELLDAAEMPEYQEADKLAAALSERYVGNIHDFEAERRFGFIECYRVKQLFGVETFLSNKEIGSFENGDSVSFGILMNNQGKPQAHALEADFSQL